SPVSMGTKGDIFSRVTTRRFSRKSPYWTYTSCRITSPSPPRPFYAVSTASQANSPRPNWSGSYRERYWTLLSMRGPDPKPLGNISLSCFLRRTKGSFLSHGVSCTVSSFFPRPQNSFTSAITFTTGQRNGELLSWTGSWTLIGSYRRRT